MVVAACMWRLLRIPTMRANYCKFRSFDSDDDSMLCSHSIDGIHAPMLCNLSPRSSKRASTLSGSRCSFPLHRAVDLALILGRALVGPLVVLLLVSHQGELDLDPRALEVQAE